MARRYSSPDLEDARVTMPANSTAQPRASEQVVIASNRTAEAGLVPPDIRLVIDRSGVIREATSSTALGDNRLQSWVGAHWAETVGRMAEPAIRRIIAEALEGRVAGYCQVNQRFPDGAELPIEYTAAQSADGEGIVAIGKNLASVRELEAQLKQAQQASVENHMRLREVENRYRLLLEGSNDAVLLLDAEGKRLIEANAAAMAAFGLRNTPGKSQPFVDNLRRSDRSAFETMMAVVRAESTAPGILVHLGPGGAPWFVRATLTTAANEPVLLLRLSRAGSALPVEAEEPLALSTLLQRWPHAFTIVDPDGRIVDVNDAFLDLVQLGSATAARDESLGRWLAQPGANIHVLLSQVERHGTVRAFPTVLHGEVGLDTPVEVSIALASNDDEPRRYGVMLCDISRRLSVPTAEVDELVTLLSEALGRRSLKQMTQDAVEKLERHYVRSALNMTDGNRTAAAQLLGLSRQSLYAKLARYGFAEEVEVLEGD
jgi:transcriptional regulator PpsR